MKKYIFLYILFFIYSLNCYCQFSKLDSLLNEFNNSKTDSLKINILNSLFLEYEYTNGVKAKECLNKALELSRKFDYKKGLATTYKYLGYFAEDKSNYAEALKNYFTSLKICIEIKDKEGQADSYLCIGYVNYNQGNYPESLKNYFIALKIYESIKNKHGIANSFNNIGNLYDNQGSYREALKYHLNSLKIRNEIGDKKGIAGSYVNLGIINRTLGNSSEALKYYFASLKMFKSINYKEGMASSYNNIGLIYYDQGNYNEALANYFASLKIKETIGDKRGMASSYGNIGDIFIKQKKYKEAEKFLLKTKILSKEIGFIEYLKEVYNGFASLDSAKGNFKGAYENKKLYILYRDSLNNEETRRKTIQSQMTYDFEKKEAVAKTEHKKELENQKAIADEKNHKQKIIILFEIFGLLMVIVFAGFIYRSLHFTRKQKNTIEKQKIIVDEKNMQLNQQNEEISTQRDEIEAQRDEIASQRDIVTIQKEHIEEIHKELTDSINYAKRIQEAVLPVSDTAREVLGEHIILFKPKDIVSGDFYWINKIKNLLFIAVADCTGHGVPGAFMSMLGISFLNEIVQKEEIHEASQILNHLRKEIINALQQKGLPGEQKDGMDISLITINTETNKCQWAGANNPLYIISSVILNDSEGSGSVNKRDSSLITQNGNKKLIEIKGDKMPIAIHPVMNDFTNHEFSLQKGDLIYLFSDGYADQFGGPKGKKFMYKQFKELLLANCQKPMQELQEIIEKAINKWKGDFEQIDDITVLVIRV